MSDPLPIVPFTRSIDSEIDLPGSKSITNRALILAALTNGQTLIKGALLSRDTQIMLQALELLGFNCEVDALQLQIIVHGMNGRIPKKEAKALMTYAFANNVLESVQLPSLKKRINGQIASKLGVNLGFEL